MKLVPEVPKVLQNFLLNVDVTNAGQAPSEEYDLNIYYQTTGDHATYYPCLQVHKPPVKAGDTVRVYSSKRSTNEVGNFVVHVILKTADGKTITKEWPFFSSPAN